MHPNNSILRERVPPAELPFPETYGLAGHVCGNPYIVSFGERQTLGRALASAQALSGFLDEIESQLKLQERKE